MSSSQGWTCSALTVLVVSHRLRREETVRCTHTTTHTQGGTAVLWPPSYPGSQWIKQIHLRLVWHLGSKST